MHVSVSILLNTRGDPLQISGFLYAILSAVTFYLMNSSGFDLPSFSILPLQLRTSRGSASVTPPWAMAWKFSRQQAQMSCRAHLLCFLFLGDHCHPFPSVQCLKNCCFMYCSSVTFLSLGNMLWLYKILTAGKARWRIHRNLQCSVGLKWVQN